MKYSLSLCVVLLASLLCQNSSAETIIVRDSIYADSITYGSEFGAYLVTTPENALGVPDSQYAHLGPLGISAILDLTFTSTNGVTALPILRNGTILLWGKKDASVDTSAAHLKFIKLDPFDVRIHESQRILLHDGLNVITVPNDTNSYDFIEIMLTGVDSVGSKGYLIDAVLLLQDRDSTVASVRRALAQSSSRIVSGYPNPFIAASQSATLVFRLDEAADVSVRVYDALGREVTAASMGSMSPGEHSIPVSMTEPQVYYARLFVNDMPSGPAYRLIAQ